MKYRESVKNSLLVYSTIHGTRLDVDDHLFATNGNGYEWIDGELSCGCTKAYGPYDAIQKVLEFELTDHCTELGNELFHYCYKNKKSEDTLRKSEPSIGMSSPILTIDAEYSLFPSLEKVKTFLSIIFIIKLIYKEIRGRQKKTGVIMSPVFS